mmetsp:Transcript_128998/g.252646  ORF Transcript_128998/g.252646 Transcript_128998/m.252646 type:complete len:383 (+) Transcript_128998:63-1211(+)
MAGAFSLVLPILIILPAVLIYFACAGHYEWVRFEQGESLINYESNYRNSDMFVLNSVYVRVKNSHDDANIHTWLLTKKNEDSETSRPLVIMSHGLGGQKDMGLLPYAEKFAMNDYAVLMIDYRYFGLSTNSAKTKFRNLIDPWNHVEDIKTVLNAVIHDGVLGGAVDVNNIVLWGTSFAGGHMLRVAHQNPIPNIKAVISQVPHLDGKAASLRALKARGPVGFLRVMALAVTDIVITQLNKFALLLGVDVNLPSIYVKIIGTGKDSAYMVIHPTELDQYFAKHPTHYLGGWQNRAPARTLAYMSLYSPVEDIPHITVPVLFITATQDTLCPPESVRAAAQIAQRGTLLEIDSTHFDIYQGEKFNHISDEMVRFMTENINVRK